MSEEPPRPPSAPERPPLSMGDGSLAQRLHPAGVALRALRVLRGLGLPVVFLLFSLVNRLGLLVLPVVALVLLAALLLAVALWWRFTFEVSAGELRVRSGLIGRRERLAPLERIQVVDITESLLQRLLGIVSLRVETAAGGAKESDVVLDALDRATALALRDRLLRARQPAPASPAIVAAPISDVTTPAPATAPALIYRLSLADLLLTGATSGRVGPALVLVFGAYQLAGDVLPRRLWSGLLEGLPDLTWALLAGAALLLGLGAWLLAIASTVLTFANFELRREGDRLFVSAGLLDRRRSTIPLARIQAVTVNEGLLRQPFGLAAVRVESAGYGKDTAASGVIAPLVRLRDVADLLSAACPAYALDPANLPLHRPPARARPRYASRQALTLIEAPALAVGAAALAPWTPWWWGLALLALLPPAALLGLLQYHDAGWTEDGAGRLVTRNRGVARTTTITLARRLQRRQVRWTPLQRRAGLATFQAEVASGGSGGAIRLLYLERRDAEALAGLGQ